MYAAADSITKEIVCIYGLPQKPKDGQVIIEINEGVSGETHKLSADGRSIVLKTKEEVDSEKLETENRQFQQAAQDKKFSILSNTMFEEINILREMLGLKQHTEEDKLTILRGKM
jgi:hypothetical protein